MALDLTAIHDPRAWDELILSLPGAHLLQSWSWGELKSRYGWKPERWAWLDGDRAVAGAQLLRRSLPVRGFAARLTVLYTPKVPA